MVFDKDKLQDANTLILLQLSIKLKNTSIPRFIFEPLPNIEANIIKVMNEYLINEGNQVLILGYVLKAQIVEQFEQFVTICSDEFSKISKNSNIQGIKKEFQNNLRSLKKGESLPQKNMPEDDDLMVVAGYIQFQTAGDKYLITDDEHFWGYGKLIKSSFNLTIIKEWECHKLYQ